MNKRLAFFVFLIVCMFVTNVGAEEKEATPAAANSAKAYAENMKKEDEIFLKRIESLPKDERRAAVIKYKKERAEKRNKYFQALDNARIESVKKRVEERKDLSADQKKKLIQIFLDQEKELSAFRDKQRNENAEFFKRINAEKDMSEFQKRDEIAKFLNGQKEKIKIFIADLKVKRDEQKKASGIMDQVK